MKEAGAVPQARVGNRIGVALNIDNLHVFDADTNLSLAYEYKRQTLPERTTV